MNLLCKELAIHYPILQGGMGNISSSQLVAAVSEAGGLGTIGCGTMSVEEVEQKIVKVKTSTSKPFAVNIALSVTPYINELLQLVIDHQVPVVSLSAGNPAPYIPLLQERGIRVIALVASVKHAKKAAEAGANVLVAEGFEAAGINSNLELTTMTLIPQIVEQVNIPVVAAGGIGNGAGLAAALALGAQGVQMGTRFIATKEMPVHDLYKQRLLAANDIATMVIGRQVGQVRRVLKNEYAEGLYQKEQRREWTAETFRSATTEEQHIAGAINGDMKSGFLNGGQVAGLIEDVPSVQELIQQMMRDAKQVTTRMMTLL